MSWPLMIAAGLIMPGFCIVVWIIADRVEKEDL